MTNSPIDVVIIPTPSRPARIAALHAAGLFLADHLDLPMPSEVYMDHFDATLEQLRAISELHGEPIQYGTSAQWVAVPVTLETLHGITITYRVFGPLHDGRCPNMIENGAYRCVRPIGHADMCFFDNDQPMAMTTPMDLPARGAGITYENFEVGPCANGNCPDPVAHAEGAHDL